MLVNVSYQFSFQVGQLRFYYWILTIVDNFWKVSIWPTVEPLDSLLLIILLTEIHATYVTLENWKIKIWTFGFSWSLRMKDFLVKFFVSGLLILSIRKNVKIAWKCGKRIVFKAKHCLVMYDTSNLWTKH